MPRFQFSKFFTIWLAAILFSLSANPVSSQTEIEAGHRASSSALAPASESLPSIHNHHRRHVWAICLSPPNGDTTTRFHVRVNTNHPSVESSWAAVISGPSTVVLNASLATAWSPNTATPADADCSGEQLYWFSFGPVQLLVRSCCLFSSLLDILISLV